MRRIICPRTYLKRFALLTNLETAEDKLLQIVLVGQPELEEKLDSVGLRQLKQRIALRARLDPLDLEETKGYIERRLQIAGNNSAGEHVVSRADHCGRVSPLAWFPRLINTICENALMTAYARQIQSVTPDIVEDVAGNSASMWLVAWARKLSSITMMSSDPNVVPDLYSALREPVGSEADMGAPWPFK